jgi:ArsR family transcriptional regulator
VQGWLRSAGLNPLEPIHFPGRRLMTGIWRGERASPRTAGRAAPLAQGAAR